MITASCSIKRCLSAPVRRLLRVPEQPLLFFFKPTQPSASSQRNTFQKTFKKPRPGYEPVLSEKNYQTKHPVPPEANRGFRRFFKPHLSSIKSKKAPEIRNLSALETTDPTHER